MATKKGLLATQLIRNRISHADYVLADFPGERQLAEELGLSRDTVRIAVQNLTEQGVLVRQANGRLRVADVAEKERKKTIAFVSLVPSSKSIEAWRQSVASSLQEHGIVLRSVTYGHWADPIIQEVLSSFDGMFFVPPHEEIPLWLKKNFRNSPCKVAVLFHDQSEYGLPSTISIPPIAERKLLDYLYDLGHRHIDCINTQAIAYDIPGRIEVWKRYIEEKGLGGRLFSLTEDMPMDSAYQLVHNTYLRGEPLGSALFCTTGPAAIGAMRALHELRVQIGRDVSVCAVNSEGMGAFLWPSLTSLEASSPAGYVQNFLDWMLKDEEWQGNLLVEPEDLPLIEGESTGPPWLGPEV